VVAGLNTGTKVIEATAEGIALCGGLFADCGLMVGKGIPKGG
jgi:hypothetical protein